MVVSFQILMSVPMEPTNAMLMLHVIIPLDHTTAFVNQDILEMDAIVQVNI